MKKLTTYLLGLAMALTTLNAAATTSPDVIPLGPDGKPIPGYKRSRRPRPDEQNANPRLLKLLHTNDSVRDLPVNEIVMTYAREFIGTPYVAKTLDQTPEREELVVNVDGVDCTTFVEYVLALAFTACEQSDHYSDFQHILSILRYDSGNVNYVARNHYFSSWIINNDRFVTELTGMANDKRGAYYPYTAKQVLKINYMTTHQSQYPQFKAHPDFVSRIRNTEEFLTGLEVRYIPKKLVGQSRENLGIRDGDIIAIVTNKKGLDISHIGFAAWGSDGKLHLLNASSIHKKVVLEPMTLFEYMSKHPSQIGIRVLRVNDPRHRRHVKAPVPAPENQHK